MSIKSDNWIRREAEKGMIYREIARRTAAKLSLKAKDYSDKFPNIVIQNN